MNDGYEEVRVGPKKRKIPQHWEIRNLGECAKYLNGYSFDPSQWSDEGLPIIRIQNLTGSSDELNYYNGDELEERYIIEEGDLLVSWSATLGAYIWDGPKAALNQHIFKVETNGDIDRKFFYFALDQNIELLERKVHGSTMKHITKGTFESTQLPLPPLPEQRRIAEILSTVDDAIQKTDEVIEKVKRLKKGVMQDLLTKGIGQKEFKKVQVGPKTMEIPKEWEVNKIEDIFEIKAGGDVNKETYSDSKDEEHPYPIYANSLENKGLYGYSSEFTYPEGSITITGRGDLGHAVYRDKKFNAIVRLIVLIPKEKICGRFIVKFINGKINFPRESTGVPQLTRPQVAKGQVVLPPLSEQCRIAEILYSLDNKIETEKSYKNRLEKLKKGLMQDLLTGKVRVNI